MYGNSFYESNLSAFFNNLWEGTHFPDEPLFICFFHYLYDFIKNKLYWYQLRGKKSIFFEESLEIHNVLYDAID